MVENLSDLFFLLSYIAYKFNWIFIYFDFIFIIQTIIQKNQIM